MKIKNGGFGKIKLIILGGVAAYMAISLTSQHSILAKQIARKEDLIQKREKLEREIEFRKSELGYIGSNEYIEQQARIRLGWLYPDEIKFVEDKSVTESEIILPEETPVPANTEDAQATVTQNAETAKEPAQNSGSDTQSTEENQTAQQSSKPKTTAETVKPSETPKPADTPEPKESKKPAETIKPTKSDKPAESPEPTKSDKPAESPKPTKSDKPAESPEPTKSDKPAETQKPSAEASKAPEPEKSQEAANQ